MYRPIRTEVRGRGMSMHLKNGMKMMTAALLLALAAGMAGCGGGEKKTQCRRQGRRIK